jgi:predicted TIM-barrel fold metal-dependent hydrolase
MATIDSDAHVLEQPRTWEFMEEHEKQYTPMIVTPISGNEEVGPQGNVQKEYWVVDGRIHNKQINMGLDTTAESREMRDIQKRLDHMDELKVDVQVLYPTLFLRPITHRVEVELALYRSYNRWLAEVWKEAPERLRWVVCPPLMSSMDVVRKEIEFGKENGACGIFMRGLECDRMVSDPYFHPLYEMASDLDMPICLHSGTGNAQIHDFFDMDPGFSKFKLAMVGAFHALIWNEVPQKFPDLRWVFVECSSQWVPYAINDLEIRFRMRHRKFPDDVLADTNIYVAVQVTDDLDYVVKNVNPDYLVCGTDYGHYDTSTEIEALRKLRDDGKLDDRIVDRMLDDNAKRLYALNGV